MATLKGLPFKLSVNQVGFGNEPIIDVGRILFFVATNISLAFLLLYFLTVRKCF